LGHGQIQVGSRGILIKHELAPCSNFILLELLDPYSYNYTCGLLFEGCWFHLVFVVKNLTTWDIKAYTSADKI